MATNSKSDKKNEMNNIEHSEKKSDSHMEEARTGPRSLLWTTTRVSPSSSSGWRCSGGCGGRVRGWGASRMRLCEVRPKGLGL